MRVVNAMLIYNSITFVIFSKNLRYSGLIPGVFVSEGIGTIVIVFVPNIVVGGLEEGHICVLSLPLTPHPHIH
jgi:hypothetical protein